MPTPIVHDPRQNRHGWWGTIVFVDDQDQSKPVPSVNGDAGVQHVFLKTSRESHFVAQGTAVKLEALGDTAAAAVETLRKTGTDHSVIDSIEKDFANLPADQKTRFHKIVAIDATRTTPLARMLNLVTEVCFSDDHWLDSNPGVDREAVRQGRGLPSLKDPLVGIPNLSK